MNNKYIGILIVVVIIIAATIGFQASNKAQNGKPTIKIGITLPLTGDVARLGESVKNSLILAKSDLPATKYNYELVFEDDQFKPALGVTTANKLINIDKVSALVSFGSPVGNVISPIAEKSKI